MKEGTLKILRLLKIHKGTELMALKLSTNRRVIIYHRTQTLIDGSATMTTLLTRIGKRCSWMKYLHCIYTA